MFYGNAFNVGKHTTVLRVKVVKQKCILLIIVVFVIPWTGDKPTLLIRSLPFLLERNHQTVKVAFSNCPKLDTTCQHDLWCLNETTKEIHLRNNYPMFAY